MCRYTKGPHRDNTGSRASVMAYESAQRFVMHSSILIYTLVRNTPFRSPGITAKAAKHSSIQLPGCALRRVCFAAGQKLALPPLAESRDASATSRM